MRVSEDSLDWRKRRGASLGWSLRLRPAGVSAKSPQGVVQH